MKTKNISLFFLGLAIFLAIPVFVFAQESIVPEIKTEAIILATVGIQEAKIVSQEGNKFKISFKLVNDEKVQPDIQYSIQLIRKEDNVVVEEKVYSEVISLGEKEKIDKEIDYQASEFLNGKYVLWIFARNSRAMTLSLGVLGDVTLNGSGEYINIDSCLLVIKDDQIENELFKNGYPLNFGVDVTPEEELIANCQITNNFKTAITFTPQFENYFRSVYGELLATQKQEPITLNAGEAKTISFIIPKISKPQAYDAVLSFLDDKGKVISNKTALHYVIQGFSGTIQNLTFDKNSYQQGESAKLSFYLTGSADFFWGSRGKGTRLGDVSLEVSVTGENNVKCSEKIQQKFKETEFNQEILIPIITDCSSPQAAVEFKDSSSNILDTKTFKTSSEKPAQAAASSAKKTPKSDWLVMLASILAAVLLAIILIYFWKKKRNISNAPTILLVIGIAMSGLFLFGNVAHGATSATFTVPAYSGDWATAIATVSLNKAVYTPGEYIVISGTVSTAVCYNGFNGGSWLYLSPTPYLWPASIFYAGGMISGCGSEGGASGCNSSDWQTTVAPKTPGIYTLEFYAYEFSTSGPRGYAYLSFEVNFPPAVEAGGDHNKISQSDDPFYSYSIASGSTKTGLYEVAKGGSIQSSSSASDPDGNPLTYKWSCSPGLSLNRDNILSPFLTSVPSGSYYYAKVDGGIPVDRASMPRMPCDGTERIMECEDLYDWHAEPWDHHNKFISQDVGEYGYDYYMWGSELRAIKYKRIAFCTFTATDSKGLSNYDIAVVKELPPPNAPVNLTATAPSCSSASLSWVDNSDNETGFKIERATSSSGPWTPIATTAANVTSYSDTGRPPNTWYYYQIRSTNSFGDSAYTSVAQVYVPACTYVNLSLYAPSCSQSVLYISSNYNLSYYKIYKWYYSSWWGWYYNGEGYMSASYGQYSYRYYDNHISPGSFYGYQVYGCYSSGQCPYSSNFYYTYIPSCPTLNLSISPSSVACGALSGSVANLTWSSANANYCIPSGTNWPGSPTTQLPTSSGSASSANKTIISPASAQTYTLTCYGAGGSVAKSVNLGCSCTMNNCADSICGNQQCYNGCSWVWGKISAYALSVTKDGNGSGTVTKSPIGNCGESYNSGTVVTLTAAAATGSNFTGWSGACSGAATTCTVTIDAAKSVTAKFTLNIYSLSVAKAGNGLGMVTSAPAGINCGATCLALYDNNTVVTLTAAATAGSGFTGWSGACSGTGVCTVTMTAAKDVTATFTASSCTLPWGGTIASGSSVDAYSASSVACGSVCTDASIKQSRTCTNGILGGHNSYNKETCSVTACVPTVDLKVNNSNNPPAVNAPTDLTVSWTTTDSPGLASCVGTGPGWNGNKAFTGNDSGGNLNGIPAGTYTYSIDCNKVGGGKIPDSVSITVKNYALTVAKAGTGSGTVTGAGTYNYNTVVTATASAATGSTFTGWSGDCNASGQVTMTAPKTCTATFTLNTYTLTVAKSGSGTVTPSAGTLSWSGNTGTATYNHGTSVTLTAAADSGSDFSSWSGAGCSGTGTCAATIDGAKSVTATFVARTLTVSLSAVPSSGSRSTSISITATVGGTATGSINYSFWWNCNNPTTSVADAKTACGDPDGESGNANGQKFDGVGAETKSISHQYPTVGNFSPKVIVEQDSNVPNATSIASVTITSQAPTAGGLSATQPNYCKTGPAATLSWNFSDPDIGDTQGAYQVQVATNPGFSGPGTVIDSCPTPSTGTCVQGTVSNTYFSGSGKLVYNQTYYWRVRVWDNNDTPSADWVVGASFTTPKHVFPTVNFSSMPLSPSVNEIVQLTGKVTDDPAAITSWTWDISGATYESGSDSHSPAPKVKFSSTGTKIITLTAKDIDNYECSNTDTTSSMQNLKIRLPLPGWKEVAP